MEDPTGPLVQRIDLGKGSYVNIHEPIPGMVPVFRHRRFSDKKADLQQARGMKRQLVLKPLAEANACVIADCVDPDHTAAKRDTPPPAFAWLVENFPGDGQGIAVHVLDRLLRHPYWLETMIKVYENKPKLLWISDDMTTALTTKEGKAKARRLTEKALMEVEDTSRRQALRHEGFREEGIALFGRRPYGLVKVEGEPYQWQLELTEAARLVEATDRLLAHETAGAICDDWSFQGVTTSKGVPYCPQTLRDVLSQPRMAGYLKDGRRVLLDNGRKGGYVIPDGIARDDEGNKVVAVNHPAILPVAQWEQLLDLFAQNKGRKEAVRRGLSGVLVCGECGARMSGSAKNPQLWFYVCPYRQGYSCGNVRITGAWVDRIVGAMVLEQARRLRAQEVKAPEPFPQAQALAAKLQKRATLQADLKAERIDLFDYEAEMAELTPAIAVLQRQARSWEKAHQAPTAGRDVDLPDLWADLTVAQQQQLARIYLKGIPVYKRRDDQRGRGQGLTLERLGEPTWR